jgi:hypothetical protein
LNNFSAPDSPTLLDVDRPPVKHVARGQFVFDDLSRLGARDVGTSARNLAFGTSAP